MYYDSLIENPVSILLYRNIVHVIEANCYYLMFDLIITRSNVLTSLINTFLLTLKSKKK